MAEQFASSRESRKMNSSIRSRLLIGIATTTVCGFVVAAIVIFVVLRGSLYREFDVMLAGKVHALATLVRQQDSDVEISFASHPMQEFARKVRPEYYELFDEAGNVLAKSRRLGADTLPTANGSLAAPGYFFGELPDGRRGRFVAVQFLPAVEGETLENDTSENEEGGDDDEVDQVDFTNRRRVTLVVARDTADIDQAISQLAWLLAAVSITAVITTSGVVAWLLNRSLRPLDELATQIARLDERGLAFRFQLDDLPNELNPVVARLNDLLGRLEEAFRRERVMTADVAHELRTPLAGLRSTLEVTLRKSRDNRSYEQALITCEEICRDTQKLVETLLALARIEAGHAVTERSEVNVAEFMARLWETYRESAEEPMLEVSFDGPKDVLLQTDPTQLRVVLANLFENAIDYTDPGGSISVSWEASTRGLQLVVENTNCQLTEDQMSQVFDRFWRADNSRAATGTHAGLGLPLCRKILEVLGASIEAHRSDGRFVVTIAFGEQCFRSIPMGEHVGNAAFSGSVSGD